MMHVSENPYKSALLTVEFRPGSATPQRPANPKGLNRLWSMLFSTLQLVPVDVKFASVECCFMRRKSLLRTCAFSVLTAFLLGSSNLAFAADVPYPVSATIEVGGEIIDMAVDEASGTVYVLKGQSQQMPTTYSLVVINGTTITATIPINGTARQIGVDSGDHTVYVTAMENKVFVIKGTSVTKTIAVEQGPHHVAVDSNTHTAYVSQIDGASVALINGGSVTNTVRLPIGEFPTQTSGRFDDSHRLCSGRRRKRQQRDRVQRHPTHRQRYPYSILRGCAALDIRPRLRSSGKSAPVFEYGRPGGVQRRQSNPVPGLLPRQ